MCRHVPKVPYRSYAPEYDISKKPRDVIVQWLLFYSQEQGPFFVEKMDPKIEEMAKYNDYATNFDPKVYIETNYGKIEGYWFVPSTLKAQHTIYSTGNWLFFFNDYYHRRS